MGLFLAGSSWPGSPGWENAWKVAVDIADHNLDPLLCHPEMDSYHDQDLHSCSGCSCRCDLTETIRDEDDSAADQAQEKTEVCEVTATVGSP